MALKLYAPNQSKEQYVKLLLYGAPGVGKTRTSCIDARGILTPGPVVFGNSEGGIMSIRDLDSHVQVANLKPDEEDPRDGVDKLHDLFSLLSKPGHRFKTLVLDSGTDLQKTFLRRVCKERRREVPELKEWQIAQTKMLNALLQFRDLSMNVIFVTLRGENKDEITGAISYKPQLPGGLSAEACGLFDEVAYMDVMTVTDPNNEGQTVQRRVWYMHPTEKFYAKDRSGSLAAVEPASFAYMYEKIYGKPQANPSDAVDPRVMAL